MSYLRRFFARFFARFLGLRCGHTIRQLDHAPLSCSLRRWHPEPYLHAARCEDERGGRSGWAWWYVPNAEHEKENET